MSENEIVTENGREEYLANVHKYGRIWGWGLFGVLLVFPLLVCLIFSAIPNWSALGQGLLGVLPLFWTVGTIEVFTYVPMLGAGASYLSFVTGNISNLKLPCALDAMEKANVKPTSEEGELISTISIAVSSIVTTFILILGVIMIGFLQPVLESPVLTPCFQQVLPALFGGLGVVFISKNPKIAAAPMAFMLLFFIVVSPLIYPDDVSARSGLVSVLIPLGVVISVVVARLLYKKGKL